MNLNLRIFCEHTATDQISHSVRRSKSVRQTDKNYIPPQSKRSTKDQSDVNIDAWSSAPIATKYGDAFGLTHILKKVWNRGLPKPE